MPVQKRSGAGGRRRGRGPVGRRRAPARRGVSPRRPLGGAPRGGVRGSAPVRRAAPPSIMGQLGGLGMRGSGAGSFGSRPVGRPTRGPIQRPTRGPGRIAAPP